ncbi:ribosome biogenesis factor YjgA [Thalassotalea nanhaiensis]|uniref:Dual-action ribosomal maturation protein DarP n=1 Tax=Thalassotalea nanhaiensis TaxID=3065648 RepID=A0ABY9TH63_9GAMM|nr:ribosome biogenesis factor YjgA [Colwelliaceae bacterium SQ345]
MKKRGKKFIDEDILIVSKTEIKNDMKDMQKLGEQICKLNHKQRAKLTLNEEIEAALIIADKIKGKHDAYHRNVQFIAKQLFESDYEAIQAQLDKLNNKHAQEHINNSKLEAVRDQLIAQGDIKIDEILTEYDGFERQRMRQLVRQAAKEVKQEKPGKSFKELFKYLKENIVL